MENLRFKRTLSILLTLCLTLSFLPTAAFAAAETPLDTTGGTFNMGDSEPTYTDTTSGLVSASPQMGLASAESDNILQRAHPQIVSLANGTKIMVYLVQEEGQNLINGRRLMYKINKGTGWSEAQKFPTSGFATPGFEATTADCLPKLYAHKDTAVVA